MRPDTGSRGKKIALFANFFEVRQVPSRDLHMYNVQIVPDVPRALKLQIISTLRSQHPDLFDDNLTPAYDGEAALFYPRPTPWASHSETVRLPGRTSPFTVRLEHVAVVVMSSLHQYISGADIDMPQDCIQALDVILRTTPLATCSALGSSFFSGRTTYPLDNASEIWFGYHQSLRPAHDRLLVNLDVSATCFHRSQPILDLAQAVVKKSPAQITAADRAALRRDLIGVKIYVTHRGDLRRKYRIRDIGKASADEQSFEIDGDAGSRTVTVAQYFHERYGLRLQYPKLPVLLVGSKTNQTSLPMEVCHTVGGERITKKLSPAQTAAMIKRTAAKPQVRLETIMKCVAERRYDADPVLNQLGMKLSPKMIEIQGRVLDPPVVLYNQQRSKRAQISPQMGNWQARDVCFYSSPPINSWGVVVLERRVRPEELNGFLSVLNESAKGLGVVFRRPLVVPCEQRRDRRGRLHYQDILQRALNRVTDTAGSPCQLLLIILPFDDPAVYSEIKRVCDTVLDVPSQCMLSKHIQRADRTYCANLLQKLNTRVGGVNSILKASPSDEFLFKKPAIVFGADVSHAAPFSNVPSIAAVVASMDAFPYKYACEVGAQRSRQELIEHLKDMSIKLLKRFYTTTHGMKPERILFYRDGVSEGQFEQVLHHELTALRKACDDLEVGYTPKITFIVVQKRHHARFFIGPGSAGAADRSGNVPAGTVVDTAIVHPRQFDFYLIAHGGIQGTSRPTHYHVLFDENHFTADVLQDFTYRQSYMYARCTRSVSLIPAVYYAHLAALRARYHMKADELESVSGLSSETALEPVTVPEVKDRTASQMYFI